MKLSFGEANFDECNSEIGQVLAHEPNNYEALLTKGEVSLAKKDGKQAVPDFEHLSALNPKGSPPPDSLSTGDRLSAQREQDQSSFQPHSRPGTGHQFYPLPSS